MIRGDYRNKRARRERKEHDEIKKGRRRIKKKKKQKVDNDEVKKKMKKYKREKNNERENKVLSTMCIYCMFVKCIFLFE